MNTFFWTCPYCEHENKRVTDRRLIQELLYCDVEDGGCDQLVVVKFHVTTSTTALKVEGEEVIKKESK